MPVNADYTKSSRVDRLYDMKDSYETYEQLRADIAAINASILNEEGNIVFDNVYDSYVTAARHIYNKQGIPKKNSKKLVFGIVVANSTKNPGRNIYVDVPLHNLTMVQDDRIFLKDETDLSNYEELIFFPMMSILQMTPQQGALCLVEIPENFPNHTISNPEDAVFIDLYRKDILVPLDIVRPEPVVIPGSLEEMLRNLQARAASMGGGGGGEGGGYVGGGAFTGDLDLCGELRAKNAHVNGVLKNKEFMDIVHELSNKYGVPPALLLALFYNESGITANATNKLGYSGLFQLSADQREKYGYSLQEWINLGIVGQIKVFRNRFLPFWLKKWEDRAYAKANPIDIQTLYSAVWVPASIPFGDDDIIASNDASKHKYRWQRVSFYTNNAPFDKDKDGAITKKDLKDRVIKVANDLGLAGGGDGRGGTGCEEKKPSTEPGTPMSEKPSDGSLKGKKILLVGDSHIADPSMGDFGRNLKMLLEKQESKVTLIGFRGISANDYINEPTNLFGDDLKTKFSQTKQKFLQATREKWDICIIALGTNDITILRTPPNYTVVANNINSMFTKVNADKKFWVSPPLVRDDVSESPQFMEETDRPNGKIPLNKRVNDLIAKAGSISATRIDSSYVGKLHNPKSSNDVHFYGSAANTWAQKVFGQIKG